MLIRRFLFCLFFAPQAVFAADVVHLSVSADYCAIKRALTGTADDKCPDVKPMGATRGLDHKALPVSELDQDRGYAVHFAFASNELTQDYREHLQRLSDVLKSDDMIGICVKLVGHTDAVGSAKYNMSLSERRAETVRLFLVGAMGVADQRLKIEGQGEKQLLPNISGADSRNRRVEVLVREPGDNGCIV